MRTPTTLLALALAASLALLVPASAQAQARHFADPAGDGFKGRALDITDLKVANRPHHVRLTLAFRRVTIGDLGVSLEARGRPGLLGGVVSVHHHHRTTKRVFSTRGVRPCVGAHVWWNVATDRVRITIPSHCLAHGHFDAIRAQVITEIGSDADYLPNPTGRLTHQHFGYTDWVRRG
jgi:hypothetical protein